MLVTLSENCTLPVDLPPALTFDCFVPGVGVCEATVNVSAETIVTDIFLPSGNHVSLGSAYYEDSAVLEQAGDVCAVFERALPIEPSNADQQSGESVEAASARIDFLWKQWRAKQSPEDAKTMRAIATLAQCEADAYAAWCALPDDVHRKLGHFEPPNPEREATLSRLCLQSFVDDVLVSRAQKLAQAAAKKRQAEWEYEHRQAMVEERTAAALDVRVHEAKAGGR